LRYYIQVTVSAKHDATTIIITAAAVISGLIAASAGQLYRADLDADISQMVRGPAHRSATPSVGPS
jgi:hypothetical protein